MERKIENILLKLGITPNLKGFGYICSAVNYILADKTVKLQKVYEFIAEDVGTTRTGVERAIRHAISKMDGDCEAWKNYIGVKRATNSVVLHTLIMKLKED